MLRFQENAARDVEFTVGTEAADVVTVQCQLTDGVNPITEKVGLKAYLSTDSAGNVHKGADANLAAAISTNGVLVDLVTDGPYFLVTEDNGRVDIAFTKTDAGTFYLNLVMPDGSIKTSTVITFAA